MPLAIGSATCQSSPKRPPPVEQFDCSTCEVPAGSTCRTRGGKVAPKYHTPRFMGQEDTLSTGGGELGDEPGVPVVDDVSAQGRLALVALVEIGEQPQRWGAVADGQA
jgi:hypothetical protein